MPQTPGMAQGQRGAVEQCSLEPRLLGGVRDASLLPPGPQEKKHSSFLCLLLPAPLPACARARGSSVQAGMQPVLGHGLC